MSSVKVICGYVWICTIGYGIHVYDTNNIQDPYASWGQDDKQQVYTLLYVKETGSILVLTQKGMYAFDSDLGSSDYSVILEPRVSIPKEGTVDLNEGVVIPPASNITSTEVWVCSQTRHGFCLLHPRDFHVLEQIDTHEVEDKARKVRHMQPMLVNELSFLAVANRHFIERWDVENRMKIDQFDMMTHCNEFYGNQGKLHVRVNMYMYTCYDVYLVLYTM